MTSLRLHSLRSLGLAWFLLLGVLSVAGRTEPGPDLTPPAPLGQNFREMHRTADSLVVWVFFRDKGFSTPQEMARATELFRAGMSERTRRRLAKVRPSSALVELEDLPVCPTYKRVLEKNGFRLRATTRWFNGVSTRIPVESLPKLLRFPFVRSVEPVERRSFRLPPSGRAPWSQITPRLDYGPSYGQLAQLHVPELHDQGCNGAGVLVGMLDTGFDRSHQSLQSVDVVAEWDFIHNDSVTANQPGDDPWQDWHGTATLSVLGGYYPGQLIGAAYGAQFALAKTEETTFEQPIEEDWWVQGLEWLDSLGAEVVSSSLGYTDWYTYEWMNGDSCVTTRAADIAASHDIVVCNAMGNEGNYAGSIIAPADADSIVSVGAVDGDGYLTWFSSIGPTYDGRTKPEVVARGLDDYAADSYDPTSYAYVSGTSLSTPLVAGCAALVLDAHPDWTGQEVRDALRFTADRASHPDNYYGWGLANALSAVGFQLMTVSLGPDTTVVHPGEILGYTGSLVNNTDQPETVQVWSEVTLPNSHVRQVIAPRTMTLAPQGTVSQHLRSVIPTDAPTGRYTYCAKAGVYPGPVVAEDCFGFEVQP